MKRLRRLGLLLLPAGLVLQWTASSAPAVVERVFSRGVYPRTGGAIGCLTALVPFSLAEFVVAAAGAGLTWWAVRGVIQLRRGATRFAALVATAWIASGAVYVAFLLLWALNYQRQPFAMSAGWDARPPRLEELKETAAELVEEANRLRAGLGEGDSGVLRLSGGRDAALARSGEGFARAALVHPFLAGGCVRPKPVLASVLLSWLGISGLYFPFTGEANVNSTLPDPELPFAASHEIAHQRGFAREDEASFVGALACRLHPDPEFRYSGAFLASLHTLAALHTADPAAARRLAVERSAAVRRDLAALVAWSARYRGPAQALSQGVNDAYLRSQGQRDGVASYGRLVDLLVAERRARLAGSEPDSPLSSSRAGSRP